MSVDKYVTTDLYWGLCLLGLLYSLLSRLTITFLELYEGEMSKAIKRVKNLTIQQFPFLLFV
jgi:hypothetical protein